MQLRCMPCIMLGHHLGDARQRHAAHAFLIPASLQVVRALQRGDVLRSRFFEAPQRRLDLELQILPLLADDVAPEILQLRILFTEDALDPLAIAFDFEIREMPRLLDRGKRPALPAHAEPLLRYRGDELAQLLGEGAEGIEHA